MPEMNAEHSRPATDVKSDLENKSASERKFELLVVNMEIDDGGMNTEVGVIDLAVLQDLFLKTSCGKCGMHVKLIKLDTQYGLAVEVQSTCAVCDFCEKHKLERTTWSITNPVYISIMHPMPMCYARPQVIHVPSYITSMLLTGWTKSSYKPLTTATLPAAAATAIWHTLTTLHKYTWNVLWWRLRCDKSMDAKNALWRQYLLHLL